MIPEFEWRAGRYPHYSRIGLRLHAWAAVYYPVRPACGDVVTTTSTQPYRPAEPLERCAKCERAVMTALLES